MDEVLDAAVAWLDASRPVAMATVIKTWGSAPRPAGSQLAVNDRMAFVGSVSGGCVESTTIRTALEVIHDRKPRRLAFGVSRNEAFDIGLACGGEIRLFVECVTGDRRFLEDLRSAHASHRSVVVATSLEHGARVLVDGTSNEPAKDAIQHAAHDALRTDRSTLFDGPGGEWFLHVRHPPRRLVIVGAVHVAQALAPMAALNGFEVLLVDPRDAFATEERFPGVRVLRSWPRDVMEELALDHRTAVVTLAHDPRLDDPALAYAVRSRAFYVGALGSRRTHEQRLARLTAAGHTADELARIKGPVGLSIGAVTTAEIATSIIADVVRTLRCSPS